MTLLINRPAAQSPLASARQPVPRPPLAAVCRPALRFVGGEPVVFAPTRSWYPSPALVADGFLSGEENRRLLRYALAREIDFAPAMTTTRVNDYRIARVLFRFPEFQALIRARITAVLPDVLRQFRIRNFSVGNIEAQLTAHGHGNFYKVHTDSGSAKTAGRVLSFVYYFCREPRPFRGGELRIYDAVARGGHWKRGPASYRVTPVNNRIVFFLSRYHHEVLPVVCQSQRFADGRFTINGWIRGEKTRQPMTQNRRRYRQKTRRRVHGVRSRDGNGEVRASMLWKPSGDDGNAIQHDDRPGSFFRVPRPGNERPPWPTAVFPGGLDPVGMPAN